MGEGAHLFPRPQPPPTGENAVTPGPGHTPASSPNTHNSPLPVFSQFFIHSTGTNTVAAAIFPSLLAEARMCSIRARGQSEAPPTKDAGNCELAIRFPAPVSHLRPAETRGPWPTTSPRPVGPFAVTSRAAPSATLALTFLSPGQFVALIFFRSLNTKQQIQTYVSKVPNMC